MLVYGVVLCERAVDTADGTEVLLAGSIMSGAMPQAGNGAGRTCRCAKYADSSTVSHKAQIALVEPFVLLQSHDDCFPMHLRVSNRQKPL